MDIRNPWTSYLTRSFEQIKASIVKRMVAVVPELKDYSQSNLFMVLVDIYAGVGELLNYYIDSIQRELFPSTALRLSSVIKIAQAQGYWGKSAVAASNDITFSFMDDATDEPVAATTPIHIPLGTIIVDSNNLLWTTIVAGIIGKGMKKTRVAAKQYEAKGPIYIATSNGTPNQKFKLGTDYNHGSASITVGSVAWELVDTLGLYPSTANVYMIMLMDDGFMYMMFGNGQNGAIPPASDDILLSYNSTAGINGNIKEGAIDSGTSITAPAGITIHVENSEPSFDGSNIDDLYSLSINIPRAVYTLNRAVTRRDFELVAEMAPGIREAKVGFICGATVNMYVSIWTSAIVSQAQLTETADYVNQRAIMSLADVHVHSAGESRIHLGLRIKTYPNAIQQIITDEVYSRLLSFYNVDVQDINGSVKVSDIYALIDTINMVDYVDIPMIYVEPYARPTGHTLQLDAVSRLEPNYNSSQKYTIIYDDTADLLSIFKSSAMITTLPWGVETEVETGFFMTALSNPGYVNNNSWDLITNPASTNIFLADNTIPILHLDNLILEYI